MKTSHSSARQYAISAKEFYTLKNKLQNTIYAARHVCTGNNEESILLQPTKKQYNEPSCLARSELLIADIETLRNITGTKELPATLDLESAELHLDVLQQLFANEESRAKISRVDLEKIEKNLEIALNKLTNIPLVKTEKNIKNDDRLRNVNSYEYLYELAQHIPKNLQGVFPFNLVYDIYGQSQKYADNLPYGDLYTQFQLALQIYILDKKQAIADARDKIKLYNIAIQSDVYNNQLILDLKALEDQHRQDQRDLEAIDDLVIATLSNPNDALHRAWMVVKPALQNVRQTKANQSGKQVTKYLKSSGNRLNHIRPTYSEEIINLRTNMGKIPMNYIGDLLPLTETSQPVKLTLSHHKKNDPNNLRLGTMGQMYFNQDANISPVFTQYVDALARKRKKQQSISHHAPIHHKSRIQHVYINNLQRKTENYLIDNNIFSAVRREREITGVLENMANEHANLAVITLPAHGGFLKHDDALDRKKTLSVQDVFEQIIAIAMQQPTARVHKHDFYISDDIRKLLFGDNERVALEVILKRSFAELNFTLDNKANMSPADRQAVFFHFIKYTLPTHILNTLGPDSFNFSCKDGIDRGGVSTAYYNLMQSIDRDMPITRDEFETLLHGPAVIVKGRAINKHVIHIWNMVDRWIAAQDELEKNGNPTRKIVPSWLRSWHLENALDNLFALTIPMQFLKDDNKAAVIKRLKNYLDSQLGVKKSVDFVTAHFTDYQGIDAIWKKQAAEKLLSYLECGDFDKPLSLCLKEKKALEDGRLGGMVKELMTVSGASIVALHDVTKQQEVKKRSSLQP